MDLSYQYSDVDLSGKAVLYERFSGVKIRWDLRSASDGVLGKYGFKTNKIRIWFVILRKEGTIMKIKALVAVRSGSQRVKNKNIKPFAGSNLLSIKLEQLKRIPNLDGIIVNSNDDTMLDIARKYGCEAVKRDEYYASNEVSMSDVYKNMAENCDCDIIAYINVTNPLIEDQTIIDAIEQYKKNIGEYDSLNSAHLVKEFLFLDNKPVNYDLKNQPRSQDLPDYYALNFAISIISKQQMINGKNVVGSKPYIYAIDEIEATDIDNPIDFEFSEYVYKKKNQN